MKKNYLLMVCFAVMALLTASCGSNTKEKYVKNFTSFVEEVEAAGADYSDGQWQRADERFEGLVTSDYERFAEQLTPEERGTVSLCVIRYEQVRAQYAKVEMPAELKTKAGVVVGNGCDVENLEAMPAGEGGVTFEQLDTNVIDASDLFD